MVKRQIHVPCSLAWIAVDKPGAGGESEGVRPVRSEDEKAMHWICVSDLSSQAAILSRQKCNPLERAPNPSCSTSHERMHPGEGRHTSSISSLEQKSEQSEA